MNVLAVLLALPLIGFFLVLASPRDSKLPFLAAIAISVAAFFVSLGLIGPVFADPGSLYLDFEFTLDRFQHIPDPVPRWCRRYQHLADPADDAIDSHGRLDLPNADQGTS